MLLSDILLADASVAADLEASLHLDPRTQSAQAQRNQWTASQILKIAAYDGLAPPVGLMGVDPLAGRSALHADIVRKEI